MSAVAPIQQDDSQDDMVTANDMTNGAGDHDSQEDDEVAETAGNAGHDDGQAETAQGADTLQSPTANTSQKAKKKKKKSKSKKSGAAAGAAGAADADAEAAKIKIARNKHMRFISSYHGPWLQLPPEILDSLFELNCESNALATASGAERRRDLLRDIDSRDLGGRLNGHYGMHPSFSTFDEVAADLNERLPPPIDPAVFRGTLEIRKLVDAASDLAVRAASGLSAAALGAMSNSSANSGGSVAAALGLEGTINGRSAAMSSTRKHRLRAMAVSKLAQAYAIDEVAASVAVMQGATAIDDIADKVLRHEPSNVDAMLVGFFHDKIPSAPSIARAHAQKTEGSALEILSQKFPESLHYFRSLAIWQTFKQDYSGAVNTLTAAMANAKTLRKAKSHHRRAGGDRSKGSKRRGKGKPADNNRHANGTSATSNTNEDDGSENALSIKTSIRSSVSSPACDEAADLGHIPGDDVERQLYFFRGMAYFQLASALIEDQVVDIEAIARPPGGLSNEGGELTLENIGISVTSKSKDAENGSILSSASKEKFAAYQAAFSKDSETSVRGEVISILQQANKDFEKFLSYFAVWEAPSTPTSGSGSQAAHHGPPSDSEASPSQEMVLSNGHDYSLLEEDGDRRHGFMPSHIPNQHLVRTNSEKAMPFRGRKLIHHRSLNGRSRYTDPRTAQSAPKLPALLTTYHPLVIEAHFSILLNNLLMGDFRGLLRQHYRISRLMEYLEGYPIFVPARSLNQSQYAEVMELLSCSWATAREKTAGIPAPDLSLSEDELLAQGPLPSLHHLVGYFTEQHATRLEEAALQAEKDYAAYTSAAIKARREAAAAAASASGGNKSSALTSSSARTKSELEKRILEEAEREVEDIQRAHESATAAQQQQKLLDAPTYNTARAEVALAWLNVAILPDLIAEEKEENAQRQGAGLQEGLKAGSSSASAAAASKSRSGSPLNGGSALSPGMSGITLNGVSNGKWKGKAAASPSFPSPAARMGGSSSSNKGKGKGRSLENDDSPPSVGSSVGSSLSAW